MKKVLLSLFALTLVLWPLAPSMGSAAPDNGYKLHNVRGEAKLASGEVHLRIMEGKKVLSEGSMTVDKGKWDKFGLGHVHRPGDHNIRKFVLFEKTKDGKEINHLVIPFKEMGKPHGNKVFRNVTGKVYK